jgi:hypothetical protein
MAEMPAVEPTDPAEEGSDLRHLGRSALWAGLALSAMLVAILAARSETGLRRITIALNGMPGSAQVTPAGGEALASLPIRDLAIEAETRRLAESVRRLAAERERLMARLDLLERSIDVTGALPAAASQRPPEAPASTTFISPPGNGSGGQNSANDTAPVASGASGVSSATPPPPEQIGAVLPQAEAPPASRMVALQAAAESSISRTEFGIDLGPAGNSDGLRALWSTVRAQHGALLEGLHPMGLMRETGQPGGAELRLVAGPLLNAAAAARLCAVLSGTGRTCQPSIFDSQRQALR